MHLLQQVYSSIAEDIEMRIRSVQRVTHSPQPLTRRPLPASMCPAPPPVPPLSFCSPPPLSPPFPFPPRPFSSPRPALPPSPPPPFAPFLPPLPPPPSRPRFSPPLPPTSLCLPPPARLHLALGSPEDVGYRQSKGDGADREADTEGRVPLVHVRRITPNSSQSYSRHMLKGSDGSLFFFF